MSASRFVLALILCIAVANAQLCPALPCVPYFGSAQIWNLVTVDGDFIEIANTDVAGRALINGQFSMGTGLGDRLYPSGTTCDEIIDAGCPQFSLAVLGRISWPEGEVQNGNVIYSEASDLSNMGFSEECGASLMPANTIRALVNFSQVIGDLTNISNAECANPNATGTVSTKYTTMTLTGSGVVGASERFVIPGASFTGINTVTLQNVVDPLSVVIVITGNAPLSWTNMGFTGQFGSKTIASRVVWVICDAPTLNLFAVGLRGSLLALNTDLMGTNGDISGNVYVRSFEGFIQFTYLPSTACSGPFPTTPAPTTAAPTTTAGPTRPACVAETTLFQAALLPAETQISPDPNLGPVNLSVIFSVNAPSFLTAISFFTGGRADVGTFHRVFLALPNGTVLATSSLYVTPTCNFSADPNCWAVWNSVPLTTPVLLEPGVQYLAVHEVLNSTAWFAYTTDFFTAPFSNAFITAYNSSYGYGTFPVTANNYQSSNYWVDPTICALQYPCAANASIFYDNLPAPISISGVASTPVTLGVNFTVTYPSFANSISFLISDPSQLNTTHQVALLDSNGTLLTPVINYTIPWCDTSINPNCWNYWYTVPLPSPVLLLPGQTYAAIHHVNDFFVFTPGFFTPPVPYQTTPYIQAWNSWYNYNGYVQTANNYQNSNYWVDVDICSIQSAPPAPSPFKLALKKKLNKHKQLAMVKPL